MIFFWSCVLGFLVWLLTATEHPPMMWAVWGWLIGHTGLALEQSDWHMAHAAQLPWRLLISAALAIASAFLFGADVALLLFATIVSYYAFALGLVTWTAVGLIGGAVGRAIGKGLENDAEHDRTQDDGRGSHSDHARAGREEGVVDPEASPWLH